MASTKTTNKSTKLIPNIPKHDVHGALAVCGYLNMEHADKPISMLRACPPAFFVNNLLTY